MTSKLHCNFGWKNDKRRKQMISDNRLEDKQNPLSNTIYKDLISVRSGNGLSKYEERARFLLYRIPVWKVPQTNRPPPFIIETTDLSEDVRKEILSLFSIDQKYAKTVVKESVCLLFDLLEDRKRVYFHERVKNMLEVRFI